MRAQQPAVRKIERVVHRPRRVIRRDVQRLEIVEIVLDLGAGRDLEARLPEDPLDPQARARDGMHAARAPARAPAA